MGSVNKRCAVCTTEVEPSTVFCSRACQDIGRVIRNAQASMGEEFTLAGLDTPDDEIDDAAATRAYAELVDTIRLAGDRHRVTVATVLAAYTQADMQLDATIWAAYCRGTKPRDIGSALDMRTSSVRRRILAFQARLHGPAPVATAS